MANPNHVKRLLQGVDLWNAWRLESSCRPELSGVNLDDEFRKAGKTQRNKNVYLTGPNLRGIDLTLADLSGVSLNFADLSCARLTMANLNGGSFAGSSFAKANLNNANMQGANFGGADFRRAGLHRSDLTRADLTKALMRWAKLDGAKLKGAILLGADLANCSLAQSQPWEARLYRNDLWTISESDLVATANMGGTVHSVGELLAKIRSIRAFDQENCGEEVRLYFRGEARCYPELRPSIMRKIERPEVPEPRDQMDHVTLHEYAHQLMDFERWYNFGGRYDGPKQYERDLLIDLMELRPEDFANVSTALDQWVLAQHHGLKTRLVDVTKRPQVALYFACHKDDGHDGRIHIFIVPKSLVNGYRSNAVSIVTNFAKLPLYDQEVLVGKRNVFGGASLISSEDYRASLRRLCQLIREEKPAFEECIDPRNFFRVFIVDPQRLNERVRAQSGAFLISAYYETFAGKEAEPIG